MKENNSLQCITQIKFIFRHKNVVKKKKKGMECYFSSKFAFQKLFVFQSDVAQVQFTIKDLKGINDMISICF